MRAAAMRAFWLLLLAMSAPLFAALPAAATYYYPWCARLADRSGATICGFQSKAQCTETVGVSGQGGFCMENPAPPPYGLAAPSEPGRRVRGHDVDRAKRHRHLAAH